MVAAFYNFEGRKKEILDLLLCSAVEKGINIHAKCPRGRTLRENIITWGADIDEYTEATYKILNIDPPGDLKLFDDSE